MNYKRDMRKKRVVMGVFAAILAATIATTSVFMTSCAGQNNAPASSAGEQSAASSQSSSSTASTASVSTKGMTVDEAINKLLDNNIEYTIIYADDENVARDSVIKQTPETAQSGTTEPVRIYISTGVAPYKPETSSSDYLLPDSDKRYVSRSELDKMDKDTMELAINEMYARHGRIFKTDSIKEYFESKPWYKGTIEGDKFDVAVFNDFENANIDFINNVMYEKGYRTSPTTVTKEYEKDYIIDGTDKRYLSYDEVKSMDENALKLAINEIYARHGCKFSDKDVADYFATRKWYEGKTDLDKLDSKELNKYESANLRLLNEIAESKKTAVASESK